MKRVVVSKGLFYTKVALLEEEAIRQLNYYSVEKTLQKGDIYKGLVDKVIPAMGAAFVNLGNDAAGFLPLGKESLKGGQEKMVQVMKESIGEKKPKLTTEISFSGKYMVFLPSEKKVRWSKKLDPQTATYWTDFLEKQFPGKGFILRSGLENPVEEDMKVEAQQLLAKWDECQKNFQKKSYGPLLLEGHQQAWQQFFVQQYDKWADQLICNDKALLREIRQFLLGYYKIGSFHLEETALLHKYGIHPGFLLKKHFLTENIGLTIEQTEALCVIDVDSGHQSRFSDFEDTACMVNTKACPLIAELVMAKDLGGIILVDFIDMKETKNKEAVLAQLKEAFKKDWKKVSVEGMTSIGLVQILRQRDQEDKIRQLSRKCPHCDGTGQVLSPEILLDLLEEEVRQGVEHLNREELTIEVPRAMFGYLQEHQRQVELFFECKLRLIPGENLKRIF